MIISAEEFVQLRTSDKPAEYRRATHDNAPLEVWYSILEQFPEMTIWVIHNKTVPLEILSVLLEYPDPDVRSGIARKRKLSDEMFRILAQDTDETVRHAIANNRKVPKKILMQLASDPSEFVATTAKERL